MFLTAIESSILVRWDVPNFLSLGLIGLVNITSAAGLTFVWLRLLFRDTDLSTPPAPILTRKMGGLQAAKVLRG
jgi:hypothetical protein